MKGQKGILQVKTGFVGNIIVLFLLVLVLVLKGLVVVLLFTKYKKPLKMKYLNTA
jgi:hypothetical protein